MEKKSKTLKVGDQVWFKIDIRGFVAYYTIKKISDDQKAFIVKDHFWKTDPLDNTWQPLTKLKLYKR